MLLAPMRLPHLGMYLAPMRLLHECMHRTPIISQPWDNLEQSQRFGIVFLEMMSCDQGAVHKERRYPEMLCSFDRHISLVWVYLGYNEVSVGFRCKITWNYIFHATSCRQIILLSLC